eukprot:4490616-Pyramimonas_sp.AAC.1
MALQRSATLCESSRPSSPCDGTLAHLYSPSTPVTLAMHSFSSAFGATQKTSANPCLMHCALMPQKFVASIF